MGNGGGEKRTKRKVGMEEPLEALRREVMVCATLKLRLVTHCTRRFMLLLLSRNRGDR